jgi:hypothetical protein
MCKTFYFGEKYVLKEYGKSFLGASIICTFLEMNETMVYLGQLLTKLVKMER